MPQATRRPHPVRAIAILGQSTGGRTWAATLPNGCEFTAWVPAWKTGQWELAPGDRVVVELCTYDFGTGSIAGPAADALPEGGGGSLRSEA
jgi:translation initiation factor IF-1